MESGDLFARSAPPETKTDASAPLAERMRPRSLDEFVGQTHLLGPGHLLHDLARARTLPSLILWGPPGSGKTTLARILAERSGAAFASLSAVLSGVKDLREAIDAAAQRRRREEKQTVLFVDEIHRFNKAQQDALLPHVERGTVILIGATTENPSFEVIRPLLSRARVLTLEPLDDEAVGGLLDRALADSERGLGGRGLALDADARGFLLEHAQGDARRALGTLEVAADLAARHEPATITLAIAGEAAQRRTLHYDKAGEQHYDVVSAFIKSMRDSDPDAALYWCFRMIEAGEDPLFVVRRMVILAAEDVGLADPQALVVANAVKDAIQFLGLPEGRIPLAMGVTYLASAPKSNAAYAAMNRALADVSEHGSLPVPLVMRNAPTGLMKELGYGKGYRYAHDQPGNVVEQQHRPEEIEGKRYYEPTGNGFEAKIRERMGKRGKP